MVGTQDNLAYYSSYGERVDVSAPCGGRKYGVPKFDTRPGTDVLYGGRGQLGATVKTGDICRTIGSPADFACFEHDGATFGWFQGTSMSPPQVTGVAALALAAKPALQEPDQLTAQLKGMARSGLVNHTGKPSASTGPSWDGTPCGTGYCHEALERPGCRLGLSSAGAPDQVSSRAALAGRPRARPLPG